MKVLVLGGTRFFGIHTVNALLQAGHEVTLATRGRTPDPFGDHVFRIQLDRTDPDSMRDALANQHFDAVIDKLAYCSNDVKYALDVLDCDRYICMSSTAVYQPLHRNTVENDYDPCGREVVWCSRPDFPYDEIKRQAEHALFNAYPQQNSLAVRYPFVIGKDDYTNRLRFYVEHTLNGTPMYIDNVDAQMSFIHSDEAGEFMAYLVEQDCTGVINGASCGTVSIRDILDYLAKKCGISAVLHECGDAAPYNGVPDYDINTDKAASIGFRFSNVHDWFFGLLDYYIEQDGRNK